jgi:hypothetical protein
VSRKPRLNPGIPGPVMAQKIMLQLVIDYEYEKDLVKQTLSIE